MGGKAGDRRTLARTGLLAAALWGMTATVALAEVPPPRDPAEALADELARAVAEGSNAALIVFIARHPETAATADARARLAARGRPDATVGVGPDAAVAAAFDAARLTGDRAALEAFAARYANHPLAAEALRPEWTR